MEKIPSSSSWESVSSWLYLKFILWSCGPKSVMSNSEKLIVFPFSHKWDQLMVIDTNWKVLIKKKSLS